MKRSLLKAIEEFLLGRKYYANIINTKGTAKCEICCYIFPTKEDAEKHRKLLEDTPSFYFMETVSFRSRRVYNNLNNGRR